MPGRGTHRTSTPSRVVMAWMSTVSALALAACGPGGEPGVTVPTTPTVPSSAPSPSPAVELPPDTPAMTSVIPRPVEVRKNPKANFRLAPETVIEASGPAAPVGEYLAELLRPATGFALPVEESAEGRPAIKLGLVSDPEVSGEAYRLDVGAAGISLAATQAAGLFSGVQTLRQLLPADIERAQPVAREWAVAGGTVLDRPRFGYRGTMLDVARHFFDVDVVKRHIDRVAAYKINRLHLHLADDQGWRIEISGWPKLTSVGGRTEVGGGKGGFYTQDEYREIVRHAASRGITVVPEVDLPGHTNAALAAYPELNCSGRSPAPYTGTQVGFSSLCIGKPVTYRFVRDVIGELAAMTPGEFLHIGGDEAISTEPAEYRAFFAKVLPMVVEAGKRPLGWHEYADADLPEEAAVQYWRLEESNDLARKAAAAGRPILMSPANKTYLDMKYFETDARGNKWAGPVSVRTAYDWDPARFLAGVGARSVLGVEAPLWTELVETEADVERMAFPRIPAIAEVGWTDQAERGWKDFGKRLAAHAPRMTAQGIAFHRSPDVPW